MSSGAEREEQGAMVPRDPDHEEVSFSLTSILGEPNSLVQSLVFVLNKSKQKAENTEEETSMKSDHMYERTQNFSTKHFLHLIFFIIVLKNTQVCLFFYILGSQTNIY